MFNSLAWPLLLVVFVATAGAVWLAGIYLSKTTDVLSDRLKLGQALGGLILLAIATNLPEIAITTAAAFANSLELAVGNILGGIAIQTVVLTFLDIVGVPKGPPLSSRTKSLIPVLEGLLVITVLAIVVMGNLLPPSVMFFRFAPGSLLIIIIWMVGLWLLSKARKNLPWQPRQESESTSPPSKEDNSNQAKKDAASHDQPDKSGDKDEDQKKSTKHPIIIFAIAAVVTLIAGVLLEQSGEAIAKQIGMSGALFGATVLAAATALPEISTGLTSVQIGDYELAISDIFGGNAFLPVLFLLATLISGQPALPQAKKADIYLTGLAMLLTSVYLAGLVFRHPRRFWRMGLDSLAVLVFYVVGLVGLIVIPS